MSWLVVVMGCATAPSEGGSASSTDSWSPSPVVDDPDPTPTTTKPELEPETIGVVCTSTENLLRFRCTVEVEPDAAVELSWHEQSGEGPVRTRASEPASPHEFAVDLLAFETSYRVEARTASGAESTTTLTTGGAPFASLESHVVTVEGTATMGLLGAELPCGNAAVVVVYDTDSGELVWYQNLDPDGSLGPWHMHRFTDRGTVLGETGGRVVEVDRMGNTLVDFSHAYPGCCGGLNHDIFDWNGFYVSQYQEVDRSLTLDNIVALDATGREVTEWRPADWMPIPDDASGDYLHANSEFVDGAGDLYVSWFARDSIIKIAGDPSVPSWGEPIWILGGNGDVPPFGNDLTVDWGDVTPTRFGDQHNAHLRHDGRLMFLDNINGRALVMTVDDATLTATVDATYPTREPRCGAQGTAMDTRSGNAVVACSTSFVREFDGSSAELLWEGRVECPDGGRVSVSRWYPLDHWE